MIVRIRTYTRAIRARVIEEPASIRGAAIAARVIKVWASSMPENEIRQRLFAIVRSVEFIPGIVGVEFRNDKS